MDISARIQSLYLTGSQGELIVYPLGVRCDRRCCRQQFQTSSPLKSLGQSKPNFMWSLLMLLGRGNQSLYKRTNGSVNAHLISGPRISTKHTKLEKTRSRNDVDGDLQYSLPFTKLVVCTFKFSGRWLQ